MHERQKNGLSNLEQNLLYGRTQNFASHNPNRNSSLLPDPDPGLVLRYRGLIALATNNDLEAIQLFRQSRDVLGVDSLERAISERLYGLALIRVQREVEGTFALERADPILERFGCPAFSLETP
jgi:hypothetical protein